MKQQNLGYSNKNRKIYFIVIPNNRVEEIEGFEEILRERNTHYISGKRKINFWRSNNISYLNSPMFLKNYIKTYFFAKNQIYFLTNNATIYYSTDRTFISWCKLRLGFLEAVGNVVFIKNKIYTEKFVPFSDFVTFPIGITGSIDIDLYSMDVYKKYNFVNNPTHYYYDNSNLSKYNLKNFKDMNHNLTF